MKNQSSIEAIAHYHVYMIVCEDNSLYTGIAKDIVHRLREHYWQSPQCAKYTRSHPMKALRGLWQMDCKSVAYQLEYRIKQLTRIKKEHLLLHPDTVSSLLKEPYEGIRWIDHTLQEKIMHEVVCR